MVAEPSFLVFEEADSNLGGPQIHTDRLQNHFRRVLPRLRLNIHFAKRIERYSAHSAMNVRKSARIQKIQNPRRDGSAQILMKRRHRSRFDVAAKARTHHILIPLAKTLDERRQ